jgi:hypothetical protein
MNVEWAVSLYFLLFYRLRAYIIRWFPCPWERRIEETELCTEPDPKRKSRVLWICEIMSEFRALGFLSRGH